MRRRNWSTCLLFGVLTTLAGAQVANPPLLRVPAEALSGPLSNPAATPQVVWSESISIPAVSAIQLIFSVADLGGDEDVIRVTNPIDGEFQDLRRGTLKQWQNHSAWFNGSTVTVSVTLAPGSTANVAVSEALVGAPTMPASVLDTLCGSDNRVLSSDVRVCRLLFSATQTSGGCTGWLISNTSTILSAGHCANPAPDFLVVAEFNYPLSTSGGSIQHPGVADQFPVDQSTIQASDNGSGDDWSVARLHPNTSGQTAAARQGSWFSLATSLPTYFPPVIVPTIRVTGNGSDSTPNNTYNYVQQTSAGPYNGVSGTEIRYDVDTTDGNSGAPVIDVASGDAIGIHTHGFCGTLGYNAGTSILTGALQAAINTTIGCGNFSLSNGTSALLSCTPAIFNTTTSSTDWVGMAVSSTSDWDMQVDGLYSSYFNPTCDFIIANGNLGTVPPVSGRMYRYSGGTTARGEFSVATTVNVGAATVSTFSSTDVFALYQFNVTSSGTYDVNITGDSSLGWILYGPGTNNDWRPRSSASLASRSSLNGGPVSGISLGTGWHAIAVYRNLGAGATVSSLTINVCQGVAPIALLANTQVTVTNPCQGFSVTQVANAWNAVAVSSQADWDVFLGEAYAFSGGTSCDYVIANGELGVIPASSGTTTRFAGSADATLQHASSSTMTVDNQYFGSLSANQIIRLLEVNITTAGSYDVTVTGDPSLRWVFHSPGVDSSWVSDNTNIEASGTTSTGTVTASLGVGWHALAVVHDGGPVTATASFTAHVCATAPPIALSPSTASTTVTNECQPFTVAPVAGVWNAVGITSAASDWDVEIGSGQSQLGGTACDFVVADGYQGTVAPTEGVMARFFGTTSASANQATRVTVTPGTPYSAAWGAAQALRIFEFTVPAPGGSYDMVLTGLAGLEWALFEPQATPAWARRGAAVFASTVGGPTMTRTLGPGVHAILVFKDGGVGISGSFVVDVDVTPNPAPTLTSISPATVGAGSAAIVLTCTGTNFVAGSIVRWDGANQPTTFVSATSVTATIPAGLLATAGTHTVTVFNPAPGGGTTAGQTFTITNPVPAIASLSPSSATAGGAAFILTVNGSSFNTQSRVQWNGANLTTTFVSATQVTASVPAANIVAAGTASVLVHNPAPGGGNSGTLTFTINNPVPTIASLSPSSTLAGSAAFTLTVNGSNFNTQSQVQWNGAGLSTTFVSATQVTASVPAANVANAATVSVRVNNPAPGGGNSGVLTFTINNPVPTLVSMSPTSRFAGTAGFTLTVTGTNFNTQSQVRWDGVPQPTTFVSATQLTAAIPAANIATPGSASILVRNPGPGGGNTPALTFTITGPAITSLTPVSIAIKTLASPATNLTVNGSGFMPTSKVYANGVQLTTTYVSAAQLTASIPASIEQTRMSGGLAIAVENFPTVASNMTEVIVGSGSNHGVIGHVPLQDPMTPGVTFSFNIEGCAPNAAFTLVGDSGLPGPVTNWPTPAANLVLQVGSPGLFPVLDGLGVFGPPQAGIVMSPNLPGNTAPGGEFILPGLVAPNPPTGAHFTLQAGYLDAASPVGFRLTWAFFNTSL